MTKKERVQTTLRHEKADMLPVDFMYEDYRTMKRFADHYGMTTEELLEYTGCDIMYCNVMDEVQKFVYDPDLMDFVLTAGTIRTQTWCMTDGASAGEQTMMVSVLWKMW